jgi:hypothetical protein
MGIACAFSGKFWLKRNICVKLSYRGQKQAAQKKYAKI